MKKILNKVLDFAKDIKLVFRAERKRFVRLVMRLTGALGLLSLGVAQVALFGYLSVPVLSVAGIASIVGLVLISVYVIFNISDLIGFVKKESVKARKQVIKTEKKKAEKHDEVAEYLEKK